MAVRWFSMSTQFLTDPKVEDLGEKHGPAGVTVLIALMCKAGEAPGQTGEAIMTLDKIAEVSHISALGALQIIHTASKLNLLTVHDYQPEVVVNLSPRIFRARRRMPIPRRIREFVLRRDGSTCQLCGGPIAEGDEMHLDHILPWSKGGPDTAENLQVAHGSCNRRKRDRF